ncbi:MAG: hypothetical protein ABI569_02115 [Casimicrobiaceae bacterium]
MELHYLPHTASEGQTPSDLLPGEYVFATAQAAADGALTVARIQVSKDGVKSPQ